MSEKYRRNSRFRRGDQQLIVALASGMSIRRASRAVGLSEKTISRRLEDKGFCRRLNTARARMLDEALGRLTRSTAAAASTLRNLLRADSDMARLGAARAILEMHVRIKEAVEVEERLAALEALAGQKGSTP